MAPSMFLPRFTFTFLRMSTFTQELVEEALDDFEKVGLDFFNSINSLIEAVADYATEKGYNAGYEAGSRDAVATIKVGDPAEAEEEYDPDVCYDPDCPVCYGQPEDETKTLEERVSLIEDFQDADALLLDVLAERMARVEEQVGLKVGL